MELDTVESGQILYLGSFLISMAYKPIVNLLNSTDLMGDPYEHDKIDCQEVLDYCEARFRVTLQAYCSSTKQDQSWMTRTLFRELVCEFCEKLRQYLMFLLIPGILFFIYWSGSGDRSISQHPDHYPDTRVRIVSESDGPE